MASNIKYPENQAMYFIEGDKLALITKVDSSGNGRTSSRKQWKAISEAVTDGILIHYYAEPNSVSAVTDNLDIDNALELAVVDYVKKCLYMDKAGTATDAVEMQASMSLANNIKLMEMNRYLSQLSRDTSIDINNNVENKVVENTA